MEIHRPRNDRKCSHGPRPVRTSFNAPSSARDTEYIKRRGFIDQGVLVVHVDDHRLSWDERELLKAIGTKLYAQG